MPYSLSTLKHWPYCLTCTNSTKQNKRSVTIQSAMEQQLNKEMAQWAADLAHEVSEQLFSNFKCTNISYLSRKCNWKWQNFKPLFKFLGSTWRYQFCWCSIGIEQEKGGKETEKGKVLTIILLLHQFCHTNLGLSRVNNPNEIPVVQS